LVEERSHQATTEDPVIVDDTFCEVFSAYFARVLITAATNRWAFESTLEAKGLGRSATLPPSEAFIEREARTTETPDGRPGYLLQIADRKKSELEYWLVGRIRKGVLPFPTTAVFDAFPVDRVEYSVKIENTPIQLFGDGFEEIVDAFGRRVYRIPRMDGFFYVEEKFGIGKGVSGGNFLIMADSQGSALLAGEMALDAIREIPFVTGRMAASGSKVGGQAYTKAVATTNDAFCPTISDKVKHSEVGSDVNCIYEIIVNGLDLEHVKAAMKVGIEKARGVRGVRRITAGNYGGKLGSGRIDLQDLVGKGSSHEDK
jgi:formylmethanofuran--tetrahydromethanopterin N-formyltransferase